MSMREFRIWVVLLWVAALVVLMVGMAEGADVTLNWDPVPGATGYKLYTSTDQAATWDTGLDVGNVTTYTLTDVVEDKLVMWRASAYNASNEAVRFEAGVWYDHRLKPVNPASGLGVK